MSQMVDHEILMSERLTSRILVRDGSWFDRVGRHFNPNEHIYSPQLDKDDPARMPNLEATRAVAAHYLGLASYPKTFFREHEHNDPKPTEEDRLLYRDYIEFYLTITGLLSAQEVKQIRNRGWWNEEIESIPRDLLFQKEIDLPNFQEVSDRIFKWKKEGWKIALFHGAFDPVTITHLQNASMAYQYGAITKTPLKLIIGFDSDELIKRKGKDRPRYPLDERREQFGRFWMVDETVVLRPTEPNTHDFVRDYEALGADYIVTIETREDILRKVWAIKEARLLPIPVPASPLPSASQILSKARSGK